MRQPKVGDKFTINEGDFKFDAVVVYIHEPIPQDTDYVITADYINHPYGLEGGMMSMDDLEIETADWK
jgi:hypothetical protein